MEQRRAAQNIALQNSHPVTIQPVPRPTTAPPVRKPERRLERRSDLLDRLPENSKKTRWRAKTRNDRVYYSRYYAYDWWWYEPIYYQGEVYYEEVEAPEDAYVEKLPEDAESFSEEDETYYTYNN